MSIPKSLEALEQQRANIASQIAALGDLRCGSITSTMGRCGKPNCHCHQPNDPGHGPNLRLTFKVNGKTVTESLPDQAATRKVEREIVRFRKLQVLHKEFVEVTRKFARCARRRQRRWRQRKKNGRNHPKGNHARSRPTVARHLQRPPQDGAFGSGSLGDGCTFCHASGRSHSADQTLAVLNPDRRPTLHSLPLRPTGSVPGIALQANPHCGR